MKQVCRRLLFTVIAVTLPAAPSPAQTQPSWTFNGGFQIGLRAVDVDGRQEKYDEDVDLDDGPRLFRLNLELTPPAALRGRFDRLELDLANLGGDPFETARFSISKYARFSLDFERRTSHYFYDDILVAEERRDPVLSISGDLHRFDLERVHDSASLEVWLSRAAKLDFSFDRFTRKGDGSTSLSTQRDEFELAQRIDESLYDYNMAFQYAWKNMTLVVEERLQDFENAMEIFLPGLSLGEDPDDATVLDFFFLDQPYDSTSHAHTVRLLAEPGRRLSLRLSGSVQQTELDFDLSERSQGLDFAGRPFSGDLAGDGGIDSDVTRLDLDLTYRIGPRLGLVLGVRKRKLDQEGDLLFGPEPGHGRWTADTISSEFGVEVQALPALTWSAGLRVEDRDVRSAWDRAGEARDGETTTGQTGTFLTATWRPSRKLRVTARLEDSSFDDPLTLASPSDRRTWRLRLRYGKAQGLSAGGAWRRTEVENEASGWQSSEEHLNVHLAYRTPLINLWVGYTLADLDREIDQTVLAGSEALFFPIDYAAASDHLVARVLWAAAGRVKLGGELRYFDNDGSFAVERRDLHGFVEIGFAESCVLHLGHRLVDYDERLQDFDDYEAGITEISIGQRW